MRARAEIQEERSPIGIVRESHRMRDRQTYKQTRKHTDKNIETAETARGERGNYFREIRDIRNDWREIDTGR